MNTAYVLMTFCYYKHVGWINELDYSFLLNAGEKQGENIHWEKNTEQFHKNYSASQLKRNMLDETALGTSVFVKAQSLHLPFSDSSIYSSSCIYHNIFSAYCDVWQTA